MKLFYFWEKNKVWNFRDYLIDEEITHNLFIVFNFFLFEKLYINNLKKITCWSSLWIINMRFSLISKTPFFFIVIVCILLQSQMFCFNLKSGKSTKSIQNIKRKLINDLNFRAWQFLFNKISWKFNEKPVRSENYFRESSWKTQWKQHFHQ